MLICQVQMRALEFCRQLDIPVPFNIKYRFVASAVMMKIKHTSLRMVVDVLQSQKVKCFAFFNWSWYSTKIVESSLEYMDHYFHGNSNSVT